MYLDLLRFLGPPVLEPKHAVLPAHGERGRAGLRELGRDAGDLPVDHRQQGVGVAHLDVHLPADVEAISVAVLEHFAGAAERRDVRHRHVEARHLLEVHLDGEAEDVAVGLRRQSFAVDLHPDSRRVVVDVRQAGSQGHQRTLGICSVWPGVSRRGSSMPLLAAMARHAVGSL